MKHVWVYSTVGWMVMAGAVQAGTILNENFDSYLTGGPYLSTADGSPWVIDGCNDGRLDGTVFSAPNAVKDYKNGANQRLGIRNRRDLTAAEMANAIVVNGGTPTCVNGTDTNPLVFQFKLYLGPKTGNTYYSDLNSYAELSCGDDRAPTPVTTTTCQVPGWDPPIFNTRYKLNMAGDGQVHRSIAVGQIAWEDSNPCDDGTTNSSSHSFRLTLYDGQSWQSLKTPVDMHTCGVWNYITLQIKTNVIEVVLSTMYNGSSCSGPRQDLTTTVTRQYLGPFNAVKIGGLHNEVDGGCWGQDKVAADHDGTVRAYSIQETDIDDVYLTDGEAYDTPWPCGGTGACCAAVPPGAPHACSQLPPSDCIAAGGVFKGVNTACGVGAGRCCANPMSDDDYDGDVDMDDFAKLQRCLTIGDANATVSADCACFDTDNSGKIDVANDVEQFILCGSGSGITADISCDDAYAP